MSDIRPEQREANPTVRDLAVIDEEIISRLPTPCDIIARWWAYVPPAILLELPDHFLTDGEYRENYTKVGLSYERGGRRVEVIVPRSLYALAWNHTRAEYERSGAWRTNGFDWSGRMGDKDWWGVTLQSFLDSFCASLNSIVAEAGAGDDPTLKQ